MPPRLQQAPPPSAKTIRLIHASLITGVLLFSLVGQFVLMPNMATWEALPPTVFRILLGLSLGACVVALLLRKRVPRRATDQSADLFWTTAATPSLVTWAVLEGASFLAIFAYLRTGSQTGIAVAAVALFLFVFLNPAYLERI